MITVNGGQARHEHWSIAKIRDLCESHPDGDVMDTPALGERIGLSHRSLLFQVNHPSLEPYQYRHTAGKQAWFWGNPRTIEALKTGKEVLR